MKKIKRKVFLIVFIILIPILLFIGNGLLIFNNGLKDNQEMQNFFKSNKELSSEYSEREAIHLEEVKELIQSLNSTFRLGILLVILMSLSLYIKNKKDFAKGLFYGGNLTIILLIIFLIIFLINFQFFFTIFHKLLFKTDYWLLESESKLLQQFPIQFWTQGFRSLFIFVFIEGLVISSLGYLIRKKEKN